MQAHHEGDNLFHLVHMKQENMSACFHLCEDCGQPFHREANLKAHRKHRKCFECGCCHHDLGSYKAFIAHMPCNCVKEEGWMKNNTICTLEAAFHPLVFYYIESAVDQTFGDMFFFFLGLLFNTRLWP